MPRDLFGDVVDPSIKLGSQKWYTVPLSIVAHVAIFAAVIIIPLMATDVLPTPPTMMAFVGTPPPAAATTAAPPGPGGAPENPADPSDEPERRPNRSAEGNHARAPLHPVRG